MNRFLDAATIIKVVTCPRTNLGSYLPSTTDTVTSLRLHGSTAMDTSSAVTLTWKYAGCLGSDRFKLSFLIIATTSDMVGRSAAFSCTHNKAMLIHLIISNIWESVPNDVSTSWGHLSSFHNCHDCMQRILSNSIQRSCKRKESIQFICFSKQGDVKAQIQE